MRVRHGDAGGAEVVDAELDGVGGGVAFEHRAERGVVTAHQLVGVDPQDPLAGAGRERFVAGRSEVVVPRAFEHRRAGGTRHLDA